MPVYLAAVAALDTIVLLVGKAQHQTLSNTEVYLFLICIDLSAVDVCDVSDSISGVVMYITIVHEVFIPPGPDSLCPVLMFCWFGASLTSTFLIVSMTFDRFFSILKPHKAVSFNTVQRAVITIVCTMIFGFAFNTPHLLATTNIKFECLPYGSNKYVVHYWMSFVVSCVFPFTSLLIMNSCIIGMLHRRSNKGAKLKAVEKQTFVILLLVTFGFLTLMTPSYIFFLFVMLVDFRSSPSTLAGFNFFYHFAQKTANTNHSVNFFFYVLSGSKFRSELVALFKCSKHRGRMSNLDSPGTTTNSYLSTGSQVYVVTNNQ